MSINSETPGDLTETTSSVAVKRPGLKPWIQLVYGMGHILNDMCASMWFTYLLVYFHLVLGFSASQAGTILLIGQVADALATPFVGLHSDTSQPTSWWSYGRRKTWHLFGTICVIGSFPFIFSPCIECTNAHKWAQLIYYSAFVVIFQIGWAAVQVSHLSLIPELTPDGHERTHLTAIRYSFTVFSNLLIYVVTWLVLHMTDESNQQIGPNDANKFQKVVAVGVGSGTIASILFHCLLQEPKQIVQNDISPLLPPSSTPTSHRSILKSFIFYQVGLVYMGTRLFVNLSQVFIPLYLHRTLALPGVTLASIPLVMYVASFVTSLLVRSFNQHLGRKVAYTLGGLIGIAGCLWMFFGHGESYKVYQIYIVVVIFGAGGALMLVTSLGLTADLIGNATNIGAFVYGAMSFSDKLANGLAVVFIQNLAENADGDFYKWAVSLGCGGSAALAVIVFLSIRTNSFIERIENEEDVTVENPTES